MVKDTPVQDNEKPLENIFISVEDIDELTRNAKSGDKETFLASWKKCREKLFTGIKIKIRNKNGLSNKEMTILAHAAVWGDTDAFWMIGEAYREFFTKTKISKMLLVHSGAMEADDLYTEALLKVNDALQKGSYDPRRGFFKYVCRTVRNVVLDYLNKVTREPKLSDEHNDIVDRIKILESKMPKIIDPEKITQYLEMFRLVCECCVKPHQILALCFVKLIKWKPQEIVEELSDEALGVLADRFFGEYLSYFTGYLDEDRLKHAFLPLFDKLDLSPKDCYPESGYEDKIKGFKRVGDIILKVFYGKEPANNLSDWPYKAKDRARNAIIEGRLCGLS